MDHNFNITINGTDYISLPYVSPSSTGRGLEEQEILTAEVFVNDHNVWQGSKYWDSDDLMFSITNLVGENKVNSLRIENLESETAGAVNELIDILLVQDIPLEEGLDELTLKAIKN